MILTGLKQLSRSSNTEIASLQGSFNTLWQQLQPCPFLRGNLVSEILDLNPLSSTYNKIIPLTLNTVPLKVPHGLLIKPSGFLVLLQDAPASVYKFKPVTAQEKSDEIIFEKRESHLFMKLQADMDVTVSVWFF